MGILLGRGILRMNAKAQPTDKPPQSSKTAPPYVSYKTFKTFLAGLRVTMPSRIDRSVLHNFSGAVKAQLNHAIHALSLVNESGVPEADLTLLVNSEGPEREKILRRILQRGYPFLFDGQISLETATAQQLIEKFSKAGATGDTARKGIAFLLEATKEAGIKTSPYFKKAGAQARGPRKPPALAPEGPKPDLPKTQQQKKKEPPPGGAGSGGGATVEMDWAQLLLSKFPSFDPAWPDDVKSKWFDAFDKLMKTQERK